ncbi:hypothetical protein VNO78_11213 [Psophocarpus tetragonolobus]|uniref:Uncharacterized protein n=1 Tax=Psophocarpus tetragonolobus TaxID=3891 RepID=A0AAN9XNG3_PSOTE
MIASTNADENWELRGGWDILRIEVNAPGLSVPMLHAACCMLPKLFIHLYCARMYTTDASYLNPQILLELINSHFIGRVSKKLLYASQS